MNIIFLLLFSVTLCYGLFLLSEAIKEYRTGKNK